MKYTWLLEINDNQKHQIHSGCNWIKHIAHCLSFLDGALAGKIDVVAGVGEGEGAGLVSLWLLKWPRWNSNNHPGNSKHRGIRLECAHLYVARYIYVYIYIYIHILR